MSHTFKLLRLTALAIFAVGVVGVPSVHAHKVATKFTNVEGGNTTVKNKVDGALGTTTGHFVIDIPGNGSVTCNSLDLEGTVSDQEPATVTLHKGAENTKCTFLGLSTTFTLDGCTFSFTPEGTLKIICPLGAVITVIGPNCTVDIKGQEFKNAAKYENVGSANPNMEITAEVATGQEIHMESTGAGCLSTGTTTKGQLTTWNQLFFGENDPSTGMRKSLTVDF
jgi:hypothetical protein